MKYYCIGIKGSGMSSLANLLYDLGNEVAGYDDYKDYKFTMDGLLKRGIKIYTDSSYEIPQDTIVTFSLAFAKSHPEIERVQALGVKVVNYYELLGSITKQFETIGVSGTHGKTTTSLMISEILDKTVGCNYFVGDGTAHASDKNKLLVIESDEFNKHFLFYYPDVSIITNIELEHTECYHDLDDLIYHFGLFANKSSKLVIANGDDENIRKIPIDKKAIYFGFNDDNNLVIKNLVMDTSGIHFDLYYENNYFDSYNLRFYGKHMVYNAVCSILVSIIYGIDKSSIKKYIEGFVPAKRRFSESVVGDNVIIDDYAHHPTEITSVYNAVSQKYPTREKIAIFLPNTYSRTHALFADFVKALSNFDYVYLMEIESDRERQEDYPHVSSLMLKDELLKNGIKADMISINTIEKLAKHRNSVISFMSCASISKIKELLEKQNDTHMK